MYKLSTRWSKFVSGIITNLGWIIVVLFSVLMLLFTQLGTWYNEQGLLSDLYNSYEEYGNIHNVKVINPSDAETTSVRTFYKDRIDEIALEIETFRLKAEEYLQTHGEQGKEDDTYLDIMNEIDAARVERDRYIAERDLIGSGTLKGISLDSRINKNGVYEINWVGEYVFNKIVRLAITDIYAWVMALMLSVSAITIKIQGNKSGKISGLKMVLRTTSRHARLSEKIAPLSKDAEDICIRMNAQELFDRRTEKLKYASLTYEDVFTPNGTFLSKPKLLEVSLDATTNRKGEVIYRKNKDQFKLRKLQEKIIKQLKKLRIKEVHTYILLETKAENKERFDFGESMKNRDRRTLIKNIVTSLVTVLPMFTAASVFIYTENRTNLMIGILGTLLNATALLFNMFSSYEYIMNTWSPNIVKKCDVLLEIGNELGVTDELDRTWEETIQKELEVAKRLKEEE